MKTVYVITGENPDGTRRFVAVKGSMAEATKMVKEMKEDLKATGVDADYHILEEHL